MGCFGDLGWSWNIKPGPEVVGRIKSRVPTAEFTESFVIWLYGASNVFLEHLAAWGGTWTAQDLEHISISIMFFGGGLVIIVPLGSTFWMLTMYSSVCLSNRDGFETGLARPCNSLRQLRTALKNSGHGLRRTKLR